MNPSPFPPIFVVGMHRSGTSAVAGLLESLGVPPARWCAESRSNTANPRGFFEPRPLVWENERLLNWLDSSWSCPPCEPTRMDLGPLLVSESARSSRVFLRCARERRPWFWKDPRLSLLLGYWEQVVTHSLRVPAMSSGVIYVVRDPAAVAASLEQRDRMDRRHAMDLWRVYNACAAASCRGRPTFVVDYDRLVSDPVGESSALGSWLRTVGVSRLADPADNAVDALLRRSDPGDGRAGDEHEMYAELLALHGPHPVFPQVTVPVDRSVVLRLHARRDRVRQNWERAGRIDRRVVRTVRRSVSVLPAAAREVRRNQRA